MTLNLLFSSIDAQGITSLAPEVIATNAYYWMVFIGVVFVFSQIILAINKRLESENHQSLVGVLIFTPLLWGLFKWYFEYSDMLWLDILLLLGGASIGFFSYVLDDLAEEAWENRHITLPLILGLAWGFTWSTSAIFQEWKILDAEVLEVASQNRAERYRWTYHQCCSSRDDDGVCQSYYDCPSYDYYDFFEKTQFGLEFPRDNDVPYVIGTGHDGVRDKIVMLKYRAYCFGDENGEVSWHDIWNPHERLGKGGMYSVGLNFHNSIIRIDGTSDIAFDGELPLLSLEDAKATFPPGGALGKTVFKFVDFFKRLFQDEAYKPLRNMYYMIYGFMFVLLFFRESRQQSLLFIISSLIIPLLVLFVIMSGSGSRFTNMSFNRVKPRWMGY